MMVNIGQFILNQITPHAPRLRAFCNEHKGKKIQVIFTDCQQSIDLLLHKQGIYLKESHQPEACVTLSCTLKEALHYMLHNTQSLKMTVHGQLRLLEDLQQLLKEKPFYLNSWLTDKLGQISGTVVYEGIISLREWLEKRITQIKSDSAKYIEYEQSNLSHQSSLRSLKHDLNQLTYSIDRLKQRLTHLKGNDSC